MTKREKITAQPEDNPASIEIVEDKDLSEEAENILVSILFKWWVRDFENRSASISPNRSDSDEEAF